MFGKFSNIQQALFAIVVMLAANVGGWILTVFILDFPWNSTAGFVGGIGATCFVCLWAVSRDVYDYWRGGCASAAR